MDDDRDWEREQVEDRRQTETFRRVHRLFKRGFRPDWTVTDVEDAIWWKHPGGHPDLILYPDGKLVASMERAVLNPSDNYEKDRIYNTSSQDTLLFDKWLMSVRPPTWWQAGGLARDRYIIFPLSMLVFYGLMFFFAWSFSRLANHIW